MAPGFPTDRPVVLVRAERSSPLLDISLTPRGLYKLWFPRNRDPYGLIDGSALFDWVLDLRDGVVLEISRGSGRDSGPPPGVLLHEKGDFRWLPADRGDDPDGAGYGRWNGYPARVIAVVDPSRALPPG